MSKAETQGFEDQFIKSYSGYDTIDVMSLQFYDVEPNLETEEGRALPKGIKDLYFDLDSSIVRAYGEEEDVVFEHKIKVVLDKSG